MERIDILEYFRLLAKYRKLLIYNGLIIISAAVLVSLVWPRRYKAVTSFIPAYNVQTPFSELRRAEPVDIAFLLEGGTLFISDVYAGIMQSRVVKEEVIRKTGLQRVYNRKYLEDVIKDLERNSTIEIGEEQIIELSVLMPAPELAAQVANTWVETFDSLNQVVIREQGNYEATYISQRLAEVEREMQIVSDSLIAMQSKYRIYSFDEEVKATIDVYAKLAAELLRKEIELLKWHGGSRELPARRMLENEISNLRKKMMQLENNVQSGIVAGVPLKELPWLQFEHSKLMREKVLLDSISSYLLLETEIADLKAHLTNPTIIIVDRAIPPEKRDWPARAKIVLFSTFFAVIFNMLLVLALERKKIEWK